MVSMSRSLPTRSIEGEGSVVVKSKERGDASPPGNGESSKYVKHPVKCDGALSRCATMLPFLPSSKRKRLSRHLPAPRYPPRASTWRETGSRSQSCVNAISIEHASLEAPEPFIRVVARHSFSSFNMQHSEVRNRQIVHNRTLRSRSGVYKGYDVAFKKNQPSGSQALMVLVRVTQRSFTLVARWSFSEYNSHFYPLRDHRATAAAAV